MAMAEYIERDAAWRAILMCEGCSGALYDALLDVPTADVVEVRQIKDYLQSKLDEWFALGDRRFEPANMWGYNFIMACFDDLAKMDGKGEG